MKGCHVAIGVVMDRDRELFPAFSRWVLGVRQSYLSVWVAIRFSDPWRGGKVIGMLKNRQYLRQKICQKSHLTLLLGEPLLAGVAFPRSTYRFARQPRGLTPNFACTLIMFFRLC